LNSSPFKDSISRLQKLYETIKALPVLVLIFTNKSHFADYPNLTNFCLKKDVLVQCVIKSLKADITGGAAKFAETLGSMPGVVEPMIDGFAGFDDEFKEDLLA
jgi:hypothetical protein